MHDVYTYETPILAGIEELIVGVIVGVVVGDKDGVGVGEGEQHVTCVSEIFCMKCVEEPLVFDIYLTHFSSPLSSAVNISLIVNLFPL